MKKIIFWIQKLKLRQNLAICLIVAGILLFCVTGHYIHKLENANSAIDHVTGFFTNDSGIWNPLIKFFGGKAHEATSKYDTPLALMLLTSIAMVVGGIFLRVKKHWF